MRRLELLEAKRHRDICIDFDNTIIDNERDSDTFLQPLPGARDALQTLRDEGYHVIVWSARASPVWPDNRGKIIEMQAILRAHAIPHDEVDMGDKGKRPALLYIDDNAVHFQSWGKNLPEVLRRLKERETA
jgi:hypothetical protein